MANMNTSKIQQLWELFIQADAATYERSLWLDVFLAELLANLKDGESKEEMLSFGAVGSMATLIGCELMADIRQICSGPGDSDDLAPVLHYCLEGRGWRCLAALCCLGVENMSCARELAELLIFIYPVCFETGQTRPPNENPYLGYHRMRNVENVLKTRVPLRHKFRASGHSSAAAVCSPRAEFTRSFSISSTGRARRVRTQSSNDGTKSSLAAATSDSEHQGEDIDLSRNKSNTIKIRLDPLDFDYFTSVVRSEDEARLDSINYTPHRLIHKHKESKKCAEDFMDERIEAVLKSKVNAFEFMQLVIEVLQNLCSTSLSVSTDNSHQVSVQVIKFAQKNLCSLQFGNSPPEFLTFAENAELKSAMTCLFLSALEKILLYSELTTTVIHNGILPVILKILEDAISKVSASIKLSEENSVMDCDDTSSCGSFLNGTGVRPILAVEADKVQEFIFGTIYGIITFQYCLLLQKCTIDKLRDFLEIFQLFMESHGGHLVEKTIIVILSIPFVNPQVSESRAKKVIDLVGQLIVALKKVRSDIIHSHQCHRPKHKLCNNNFLLEYHHHQDIFGSVYSTYVMSNTQQSCCIAFLFMVLARLLQNQTVRVEPRILRVMSMCGTCCCLPVGSLMHTLVDLCRTSSRKNRALIFTLLEQTVYPELGAFAAPNSKSSCIICSKNSDSSVATMKYLESAEYTVGESLYETSLKRSIDGIVMPGVSGGDSSKGPWKCVEIFKDLLVSPNSKLCYAITLHLLKVAPRCTVSFKRELIFGVFYPVFLSAKNDYLATKSHISKFTILSCLSMFSSLLSSILFAEHFIGKGGLIHILELISLPPFSKLCCHVLEIMAIVEIARLECDWKNQGSVADSGKADDLKMLPSLSMLQRALQASCKKVLAMLEKDDRETIPVAREVASSSEGEDSYVDLLGNVSVFWRSCANLAVYSPLYRHHLLDENLLEESYHILFLILRRIVSGKLVTDHSARNVEIHLHMKMVEATLTVLMCGTAAKSDDKGVGISREMVLASLQDVLLGEELVEQVHLRHLCDALLRCSVVECSKEPVLPPCRKPRLPTLLEATAWDEGLSDEEEEAARDGGGPGGSESSSWEDAYVTADEGYEADVEQLEARGRPEDDSSTASLEAARVPGWGRHCRQPDLCSLAVRLLVHYTERFPGLPEDSTQVSAVVHCVQRLVALCRDNSQNCVLLAKHGLITKLLQGFSHILGVRSHNFADIQRIVLELVGLLAKHCITPEELALYLSFFKTRDPPVDMLLSPLVNLVVGSEPQPNYILCFPADLDAAEAGYAVPPADGTGTDNLASNLASSVRQQHMQAGVSSSWLNCAVALPINTDLGWSMWLHGFSLSMWLRLERGGVVDTAKSESSESPASEATSCSFSDWGIISDNWNKENPFQSCSSISPKSLVNVSQLHLFSIGYETLMLEAWVDTTVDSLVLRLTRPDSKSSETITESTVENILPSGYWNHLAVNVRDYMQKRKNVIEVVLIVNGYREVKVLMTFGGLLVRKSRATVLLLGQTSPAPPHSPPLGACYLGSVMLFRSPVFTRERAMYLVGLGPNHINLTECDVDRRSPNFTSLFGPKTLKADIDWEMILDGKSGNLKELQDNLLLIYSAQNPTVVSVYPQVVTNPNSDCDAGMVSSFFPGQPSFRVVTPDQRASQQLPLPVQPVQFAALNSHQYQGTVAAATLLGGTPVFLFLFARVVELEASQQDQARALFLLLKLVQSDSELFSQFVNQDCYKLLHRVLSSPRCTAGHHVLKAVLDTCCDKPVLQFHPGLRKFQVVQQSDAIIVNSFLLSTIVGSWRDWESTDEACCEDDGEGGGVLGTLFRTLHVLLRDDHPYREFNAAQLNRVRMVDALLLFCKERFLYDESPQLHTSVACSLVELVRSLMGAPPEFCHVVAVSDFLVLLHRASATYITHARSSFYFLLAPVPPSHPTHGKNLPGVMQASDEVKGKPSQKNADKQSVGDFTQAIDPQKLSKALTNLQIKQNSVDTALDDSHMNSSYKVQRTMSLPVDSNRVEDSGRNVDSGISGSYRESSVGLSGFMGKVSTSPDHDGFVLFPSIVTADMKDSAMSGKLSHKDMKQNHNDREKFTSETEMSVELAASGGDQEKWVAGSSQCLVVEGLLMLLRDTLLVLPDNMAHQVLNHVVRAESLLVMANHADPRVRTAVVKVLNAYMQRSTDEEVNKFVKMKGFYQLANQLAMYPATLDLVEACVCLVTRCHTSLEDQLETAPYLADPSFLQLSSFPPLLALLPRAVHDVALAHNVIVFLRDIVSQVPNTMRPLLDCGLTEVLVKTLMAVAHGSWVPTDVCNVAEEEHLISDVHMSLVSLAGVVLLSPQAHHTQVLNDLLLQLTFVEQWERGSCGVESFCVTIARNAQCAVLEGALDILWDKLTATFQPNSNIRNNVFLASVLSTSYDELPLHSANERLSSMSVAYRKPAFSSQSGSYSSFISKTHAHKEIPRSELNERFKSVLVKAVDFVINIGSADGKRPVASTVEQNFSRRLLSTLLLAVGGAAERRSPLWAARDVLRTQAGRLLAWMLSPVQSERTRMFAVHALRGDPRARDLLTACLRTGMQMEQLSMFVWELLHNSNLRLNSSELHYCQELYDRLLVWNLASSILIENSVSDLCLEEVRLLIGEMEKQHILWQKQIDLAVCRSVYRFESLMKAVADCAMAITRTVVEAQNSERKVFMEHIKAKYSEDVHVRVKWQKIIQQLTHERAVWFFPQSYPRSWQLDATEGPGRVRNRLQRCHLNIGKKYLMSSAHDKLDAANKSQPLAYLFERDSQSSTSSVLIERLHTNEKIQHMCTARVVTPANEVPGELLIGESCLYFVADDSVIDTDLHQVTAGSLDVSSTAWQFDSMKEIHNRRYQLQERALEIFLLNGKTYLIAFESSKERDMFVSELSQCQWINRQASTGDSLSDIVQLWREGLITNWEYLTQLNKMAGRSYNDLMQYPVYPFVLADYQSKLLDLTSRSVYRNFKKPMAVQDKKNEQHYINYYNYLKQEMMEGPNLMSLNQEPHHYGSHYSNSGTVLHFLVRLPPFTRMFLSYQDNNFDLPDRTFHSIQTTWRLTSTDSTTDVKELIPEFFYLPEFLVNMEDFNFGARQNGVSVNNVELPPWCENSARLFVLIHRQALESDYVRENLPHWIDLVFGYKQMGKAAVEAINVFHPATYYGFDLETIKDPLERTAWETMVRTYGQTPRQLFRSQHPMVVQSLSTRAPLFVVPDVIPGVKGLKWGSYVGSPSEPAPSVVWKQQHKTPVASLVSLVTNDVFGLAPHTSILLTYNKERGPSMLNATSVMGAAIVSWGHSDRVVRVKLKKEQPPWPVIKATGLDPICLCASAPDCNQLWLGHWSGRLAVYQYRFNPARGQLEFRANPSVLLGHAGPVLSAHICPAFSVAVTSSQDGSAVIWDLNSLCYVRSLPEACSPVCLSCVSHTSGDIATVCHSTTSSGSVLRLHTVNAAPVAEVSTSERITALCFSNAPEGVSVNVVAVGLATGVIRLFSSWDLSLVRMISSIITHPIISLTYSHDAQHLYAAAADGLVVIWEASGPKGVSKTPKFLNLTSRMDQSVSLMHSSFSSK
ncbi:lysosomal-trafficking regulator isoform X2 [Bacillus rossius redtenbacheri]|uniref:lysosomal-trafficking regulator isoform X2 n=1 Tax=Bacillus rossius redtenbacheri TaxID=93214 RepID=UPI002FDCE038